MQELLNNAVLIPLQNLLAQIYAFLPNIFAMILILIIGFLFSVGFKFIFSLILKIIRFNKISYRIGFSSILEKAGIKVHPSDFLTKIVYWISFAIFIMLALNALKIQAIDRLVSEFFLFFPNVIAGIIIFFAGYLLSVVLERTVLLAAVNYQVQFAKFISRGVQILILIFFLAIAIEQIGIGESIVTASFTILFGGIVLALALAFGLGGRNLGKQLIEKQFGKINLNDKNEKDIWSHV